MPEEKILSTQDETSSERDAATLESSETESGLSRLERTREERKQKIENLEARGIEPFAPVANPTHSAAEALTADDQKVTVAGRVMSWRGHGKIQFADVVDQTGKIQVAFKADVISAEQYELLSFIDTGDFIEAVGETFTTKAGERTVMVHSYTILSKALTPPPAKYQEFADKEERFRKRYLDLMLNPVVKQTLDKRWQIERAVREYMWSQDYFEVETPVLQNLYGGTNAKPFTTHLNALDIEMYLRVAPELYLKRLIVGGYERIFEIARNFRNEGMDQTHQPEFTMVEFYEAYADYNRIMDRTEGMMKYVAEKVNGSLEVQIGDVTVDLSGKWRRITVDKAVQEYLGFDWETISDDEIQNLLAKHKIEVGGEFSRNKALFAIYDKLVTGNFINPTWVTDYPREVSPLSRQHRTKSGRVERFEGYVGGKEIFDGWSEIVTPLEQRRRFEQEQRNMRAGDAEAQPLDEEFLEALSYGCPPLGGIGFGVDRLVMFLTNTWAIREVIAFPLMRPKGE